MEPGTLDDDDLLDRLRTLVRQEREDTAEVVAHLAEVERRDLACARGYSSLFEYCVKVLGYSESSAYHRIRAARAVKKKPHLLALLRAGELHLEALILLHPHLDNSQSDELVQKACGKTKREIETFLAPISPCPAPRETIRVIAVRTEPVDDMPLFEKSSPSAVPETPQLRSQLSFSAGQVLLDYLVGDPYPTHTERRP